MNFAPHKLANVPGDALTQFALQFLPYNVANHIPQERLVDDRIVRKITIQRRVRILVRIGTTDQVVMKVIFSIFRTSNVLNVVMPKLRRFSTHFIGPIVGAAETLGGL